MTPGAEQARSGADPVPALIVDNGERRRLSAGAHWRERLLFVSRIADLIQELERPVSAVLTETRDADGAPVLAAIRRWVESNARAPIIVWTGGSRIALREILDLSSAGGDVRLVLHPRHNLSAALDRLLSASRIPHPGAVPALLRGVVTTAPVSIQPELTLAAYHAWPRPSVQAWAESLDVTRQALNRRLSAVRYRNASAILDHFSAAEIGMRLTTGMSLRDIAAEMGRPDDRSLRRRLALLRSRPEQLRDESDFRALIPRIDAGVRRQD
jgi:hypothetical protein